MNRAILLAVFSFYVVLALGIGVQEALPAKKPPTPNVRAPSGETAAACGFLMPADTKTDRQVVRGWRSDCGIFPPSVVRSGPMGPPAPLPAPAGDGSPSVAIEL